MKEYYFGDMDNVVDYSNLRASFLHEKDYSIAHKNLVIPCHDIMIEYQSGILLVERCRPPAKGQLYPIGGRIQRGISTYSSLEIKALEECNLELTDVRQVGLVRTFFSEDPFNHGRGTDTIVIMYVGKGYGKLRLDENHQKPVIVTPLKYTLEFRRSLHPYVLDFMDIAIELVGS
ncbi:MAG: hypothetical protein ABH849_03730 [Nanoarchaeota archaeon]